MHNMYIYIYISFNGYLKKTEFLPLSNINQYVFMKVRHCVYFDVRSRFFTLCGWNSCLRGWRYFSPSPSLPFPLLPSTSPSPSHSPLHPHSLLPFLPSLFPSLSTAAVSLGLLYEIPRSHSDTAHTLQDFSGQMIRRRHLYPTTRRNTKCTHTVFTLTVYVVFIKWFPLMSIKLRFYWDICDYPKLLLMW